MQFLKLAQGSRIWDLGSRIKDEGSRIKALGSRLHRTWEFLMSRPNMEQVVEAPQARVIALAQSRVRLAVQNCLQMHTALANRARSADTDC